MKIRVQIDIDVSNDLTTGQIYKKMHEISDLIENEKNDKAPSFFKIARNISDGWWWDIDLTTLRSAHRGGKKNTETCPECGEIPGKCWLWCSACEKYVCDRITERAIDRAKEK